MALAKIEAARTVMTVAKLADEYFERMVFGKWKHPNIVRSRIEKDINPHIGKLALEDVEPRHIDAMLQTVVKRGAPTMTNDVLRWRAGGSTTPSSATWRASTPQMRSTSRTLATRRSLATGRCPVTS